MDEQQNTNMGNVSQPNGSSSGPVIGVIVILVIVILAGLYFWGQRGENVDLDNVDQTVESITTQDASDDTSSIENDLNNTDIEGTDAEINAS